MRIERKTAENPSPQYDHQVRMKMKNSLNLLPQEVDALLAANTPFVVRIKMPQNEFISFEDMIRGEISNDSNLLDDKVLLKADGMPTYHLAVVVDDYLMKISHAFRGEEWLPSAPVHILLWKYLGWESAMPKWAHLPLILKPDGNGKLSKRDAERLGFPIFAMDWVDAGNEITKGFKEIGFMPEAFVNLLAMLGWSSTEAKEIFSMDELIEKFSIERVHKGGAKFDFEKAKWYNHEWIKLSPASQLITAVKEIYAREQIDFKSDDLLLTVIGLVKDRCILLNDFVQQGSYFFHAPHHIDYDAVKPKWGPDKILFFQDLMVHFEQLSTWTATDIESSFKNLAAEKNIKPGELQLPFRVMLVGGKFGPAVFQIAEIIGREETIRRCQMFSVE
jgi:glutamyl-tRNA synthetase